MFKLVSVVLAASLICCTSAFAQSTRTRTLVIAGLGTPAPAGDVDADGQCNVAAWIDHCSALNACQCYEITNVKAQGNVEKGKPVVSNFFVTVDSGVNPATAPAVGNGPEPVCNLLLGVLTVSNKDATDSATVNMFGASCKHVIDITKNNPSGNHNKDLIRGGWGISDTPAPNPAASGWGVVKGQVNSNSGKVSLAFTGKVTR